MTTGNGITTAVPALRFPEFQNTEGWKKCTLEDFLLEQPRYGINAPAVPFQKELPTYIRITDISENGRFLPNPKVSVNHHAVSDFYLTLGDLVFTRTGASVGKCYKYREEDGKLVFAGFLIKISPNQLKLSSNFLFHFTFTQQYWKWIDLTSTRSGQPGINGKELASMVLYLPIKDEQQKIADCLSSLDDLIEATTQKVNVLTEHKKRLMQRLFPAGGKNVPDLRFPEFQNTEGWEEKNLGEVVKIKGRIGFRGYTTKDIVEQGKGAISLSPTNITENGSLNFEKSTYISWKKYDESPEIQLKKGYIVLVKTGSSYGKSALVKELPTKTTVNPQIVVLKPNEGENEYFISTLISHSSIQKQIKCAVVGGAIPTLSQESISKFNLLYPKKLSHKPSEQEKIADCLSSLDKLIEATSRKAEILKEHKKGLMQQLFPKI